MHAAVDQIDVELQVGDILTRGAEWGGLSVRHLSLPPGADFRPLFKGLPDDACQSAHWGYVVAGSINVQYADGTIETTRAGELYYWPANHTGWTDEGVTFIEFSPAEDIRPVLEHVSAQL